MQNTSYLLLLTTTSTLQLHFKFKNLKCNRFFLSTHYFPDKPLIYSLGRRALLRLRPVLHPLRILMVFRIMDLNLKRFLAYYGKIILMPEILMGVYHCNNADIYYNHRPCVFNTPIPPSINRR